jgi:hypothetical protein
MYRYVGMSTRPKPNTIKVQTPISQERLAALLKAGYVVILSHK